MTLRARLAWTYGAILAIGLMLFAAVSILVIDRTLRDGLDAGLTTAAQAAAVFADVENPGMKIDPDDRAQLHAMFGGDVSGAIVGSDGRAVAGSPNQLPGKLPAAIGGMRTFDIGTGKRAVRVAVVPIHARGSGAVIGASLAWRQSDWIGDVDRIAIAGMASVAAIVLGIAVVMAGLLAARTLAPLDRMSKLAAQIEARDLSRRLDVSGSDELARLCAAFDRMLDRLEAAFARQRRFTADASHELRAPLAVIRAEADLALNRERDAAEYRRTLQAVADEADRIEDLVEALLVAARADAGAVERRDVDLSSIARTVAERLDASARAKNVTLRVTGRADASILADPEAVQRALIAIVHNAIVWAPALGCAEIEVLKGDGVFEVVVRDDGPGFSNEALEHALERFWRGDPARRRGSTGLGLAIARALIEANGGTIALANAIHGGAEVRLTFRRSFIGPSSADPMMGR